MTEPNQTEDSRPHVESLLARQSLLDRAVERSTETPVVRMLPDCHVIKIGGRSIMDAGRDVVYPVAEALATAMRTKKLIIGTGGGVRTRHVFSIGLDLGLPTGALAPLAQADALATAHMLGTLLAPYGVVAIPPETFGALLPLLIRVAPAVIFNGVPPYSLWEHPPALGRIPPHRTDAGAFLVACSTCSTRPAWWTTSKWSTGGIPSASRRRPGGVGLTRTLLARADVANADVLELAPGLGRTATEIVARHPRSYLGAEKDPDAAETGQPDASVDVVIGEAMLNAQSDTAKHAIVAEASRVLRPNGRYVIHEYAFTPGTVPDEVKTEVRHSLARAVKHDVLPLTVAEWSQLLADHGLIVDHVATAPSAMLEPGRLIADEGIFGALRFVKNVLTHRDARRRVLQMRRAFRNQPLVAVAIVAHKPGTD